MFTVITLETMKQSRGLRTPALKSNSVSLID